MSFSRFSQLAAVIAESTAKIEAYCKDNNIPTPSFEPSEPIGFQVPQYETEVVAAQAQLVSATMELHNLAKGPAEIIMGLALLQPNDILALQAVSRFDIASHVPLDGNGETYETLSKKCGVNQRDLTRLLRQAMVSHIFQERDGRVSHTTVSKLLATNPNMRQFVGLQMEEYLPSVYRTLDAIQSHDGIHSPEQSGFSLGHNTLRGLYGELERDKARGERFAGAMAAFASPFSLEPLGKAFDWGSCKLVVDVGGGQGPVSIAIAKMFPLVEFVVQDLASAVAKGPDIAAQNEVGDRVRFEVASFLDKQKLKGADVYYFRAVFLNWPDQSCVEILKNQIPALKAGAHILIEDVVPYDTEQFSGPQKIMRALDLTMLTYFGGGNRSIDHWKTLIASVDSRLSVKSATLVPKSYRHLIDVVWDT